MIGKIRNAECVGVVGWECGLNGIGGNAVHLFSASWWYRLKTDYRRNHITVWSVWRCICKAWKSFQFDLASGVTYRDVFHQNEIEQSAYNFEHSDVEFLLARSAPTKNRRSILMHTTGAAGL